MSFYLYGFIDVEERVIYIGRTNDIRRRILKEHFADNTHLPKECYLETEKVEYLELMNESEEVAYEAILINQIRPKYNIQFKAIAVQLSVPIIGSYCISSKEIEKRADHRPFLSDLEYNGLRTYPDNIQLLYRDWMYNMESEQKNIEEIIIVKNMLGDIYCANMVVVDGTCANL